MYFGKMLTHDGNFYVDPHWKQGGAEIPFTHRYTKMHFRALARPLDKAIGWE